jgi:hypothetical protein
MLDTERQFFDQNREDLLRKFPGKFVVIKDQQVRGSFDSIDDALAGGAREYGIASFLVRRTDQVPEEVSIPALMLGLLRADPSQPNNGSGTNP